MCGIVGYAPGPQPSADTGTLFAALWREGLVRGTHAVGLAQPGREVCRAFNLCSELVGLFDPALPAIAHTRYCTSGDWQTIENNQPIVVGDMALAFNGVIHMGTKPEFEAAFDVRCQSDNDGEVFLQRRLRGESASSIIGSLGGSFAGVWLEGRVLYAARNARRPLWHGMRGDGSHWFASTRDIFRRARFGREPVELTPLAIVEFA